MLCVSTELPPVQDVSVNVFQILPKNYKIHRHCFTGNWTEAEVWLSMFPNSYIGLTPLITWERNPRAQAPRQVAARIPLTRLLLETDAPYFVPRCVSILTFVQVQLYSVPQVCPDKGSKPLPPDHEADIFHVLETFVLTTEL